MARIIMVGSRKGGTKKSTTVVNLAHELSQKGKRVLVLDFDSQGDATKFYKPDETEYYLGDLLLDRKFDIHNVIYPAEIKGVRQERLFIIPARRGDIMTKLDMEMFSIPRREERLRLHLEKVTGDFDFILIDTSPGTSVLGLNAVMAASEYIFPTEYREHAFDGVETLLEHIQEVRFVEEDELKFKVLLCGVDRRERKALEFGKAYLAERWPENHAKTIIYHRSVFGDAEQEHVPVSVLNAGHEAARYYKSLATEIINDE